MAITEFFAGIAGADFGAMRAWYERLLGKPPHFFPQEGEAVWRVTEHARIYVVADAERVGKALLTILVDDLDDQVAQLEPVGAKVRERAAHPTRLDRRRGRRAVRRFQLISFDK